MIHYRKIYEQHYGPIPIDSEGRTYDIHHDDGNRNNNDPSNLLAVSIQEHYWIHWLKKEYRACYLIARKMKLSPEILSSLATKSNLERVKNGTNPFCDSKIATNMNLERSANGTHPFLGGKIQSKSNKKRVKNGTHNWLGGAIQKETCRKMIANGTHPWLGDKNPSKIKAKNGTHPWQYPKTYTCPHCNKTGKGSAMSRWHFNNCKVSIS